MRLLLAEDNEALGKGLYAGLSEAGYAVDWVKDGETALSAIFSEDYDVITLDIGLPKKSGLEVLADIRSREKEVPVLILTARDTVSDKILGLESGADDYLVKPFDLNELVARLSAIIRRSKGRASAKITYQDIVLDPSAHLLTQGGKPVELSPRAFEILKTMMENKGRVMSRSRLEESMYSWKDEIDSNAIEVYIYQIRKKLGSDLIKTIRGVGYILG